MPQDKPIYRTPRNIIVQVCIWLIRIGLIAILLFAGLFLWENQRTFNENPILFIIISIPPTFIVLYVGHTDYFAFNDRLERKKTYFFNLISTRTTYRYDDITDMVITSYEHTSASGGHTKGTTFHIGFNDESQKEHYSSYLNWNILQNVIKTQAPHVNTDLEKWGEIVE